MIDLAVAVALPVKLTVGVPVKVNPVNVSATQIVPPPEIANDIDPVVSNAILLLRVFAVIVKYPEPAERLSAKLLRSSVPEVNVTAAPPKEFVTLLNNLSIPVPLLTSTCIPNTTPLVLMVCTPCLLKFQVVVVTPIVIPVPRVTLP